MIGRLFRSVYHWMALSGLMMKDDEPLEVRDPDRQWGPQSGGLMLSAKAKGQRLSLVIKNAGTQEIRENIPEWVFFYRLDISGAPPLTTFGKRVLDPSRPNRRTELVLTPGKVIEAEIPVDSLYDLGSTPRQVTASCEVAGTRLVSNGVTIGESPRPEGRQ
jgi:hypothetical protein